MDPNSSGLSGSIHLRNQSRSHLSNQNHVSVPRFENTYADHDYGQYYHYLPDPVLPVSGSSGVEDEFTEDFDFSDTVLGYITRMLMEEDMEEKTCMLQESLDLQAAEKSLYEAIGKKYPPSPEHNSNHFIYNGDNRDDDFHASFNSKCIDHGWMHNLGQLQTVPVSSIYSASSYSSSNSVFNSVDGIGLVDSPNSTLQVPDLNSGSQSIWNFRRGVEEANKFLPGGNDLLVNLEASRLLPHEHNVGERVELEGKGISYEIKYSMSDSRTRKNTDRYDFDPEERINKQAAVFQDSILRSKLFDKVLVHCPGQDMAEFLALQKVLRNGVDKKISTTGQSKGSRSVKGRGKKQSKKKEVVDLRTLLINCAQAVAADDPRSGHELIKKIRQHSSPFGDGNQRLAHCLANGLEARFAGTGSQIYKGLVSRSTSAADLLKAYHLYIAACPFRKLSNFLSSKTILGLAANTTRIHVIDFGILYGFQWPTLIHRLSAMPGGPPKLRITGIEFPQPGFRPAERVEETGRRLAAYAEEFKVEFEYNAIGKKWDTIRVEELKIEKDEILVVNCLYRAKNLYDETVTIDNSRDIVLKLIRRINPDIFIHGVVNGAYSAPFFVTRFREVMYHFSAMFDMLETIVPREDYERLLLEKEIFGREALNVIACEGWERVERPETYKQWHVRNLRAGFEQLSFDSDIVKDATNRVRSRYHKEFVIDEDSQWILHGWKGRILYALSAWKPV